MKTEVKLVCGEALPFRETFQLVIGYEHGDADFDTQETYMFPDTDDNKEKLQRLVGALWWIGDTNDRAAIVKYFADQGDEAPELTTNDLCENYFEYDRHYDNGYAQINSIKLFWYDFVGIQYEVDVYIDGRKK